MGYTYQTSPLFTSGTYITAYDHALMSKAWNDRVSNGPADVAMRIHEYIWSTTRQVRNPAEPVGVEYALVWPAQHEYNEFYAYVKDANWPVAGPGEYEGANLANPSMAFIFGNPQIYGEGDRFAETMPYTIPNGTPSECWEAAKYQRGAIDLATGNQYVPMFEAAQTHMMIQQPAWSAHGKSIGGFMPTPRLKDWCDAGGGIGWFDQEIKFTRIDNGFVVIYPGTCGPSAVHRSTGEPGGTDEVSGIWEMPFAYFVFKYDGSVDRFDKKEWIFGPLDGGGTPRRVQADSMHRLMINPFLKDFRGNYEQRSGSCYDIAGVAFDYQYFYTSQYQLAPQYATTVNGQLTVNYPTKTFTGHVDYGTATPVWSMHPGFRFGGHVVRHNGCPVSFSVARYENGVETGRTTLFPDTGSIVLCHPSGSTGTVQFRILDHFTLPAGVSINIEASELYDYKPEIWDAYAYVRQCSSDGVEDDMRAYDYASSATISDNYKRLGCVLGTGVGQQITYVDGNSVMESFRQFTQKYTRNMNRHQLMSYEVINDGGTYKSVLYMHRHIYNLDGDLNLEAFEDIINYENTSSNGIVPVAPPAGWTNEWVMNMSFNLYGGPLLDGPNNASEWKPAAYGDYFGFIQRCHLNNPQITDTKNPDLFAYFMGVNEDNIQQYFYSRLIAPEALSAYTYVRDLNAPYRYGSTEEKQAFYRSCQIYPDPYRIESASSMMEGGTEVVRLQFNRRFQTVDSMAASTVDRNIATWGAFDLPGQLYRTEENALMEYLIAAAGGAEASGPKIGDASSYGRWWTDWTTGNAHASVLPRFYFTKLVPTPYLKQWPGEPLGKIPAAVLADPQAMLTASLDISKSLIDCERFNQMEFYLRAMAEGYVNSEKSANCGDLGLGFYSSAWDFTWEDLNYQAHGSKWWNTFPDAVRTDNPIGYGPPPNTLIYGEALTNMSKAINKLNRVRVPLPYQLLCKTYDYTSSLVAAPINWCGGGCGTYTRGASLGFQPPSANVLWNTSSWDYCGGMTSIVAASWALTCDANGNPYIGSNRRKTEYRFEPTDPDAYYAMNQNLRDIYDAEGNGFFAQVHYQRGSVCARFTSDRNDAPTCQQSHDDVNYHDFFCGENGQAPVWDACSSDYDITTCTILNDGVVDVGATPPPGDFFVASSPCDLGPCTCGTGTTLTQDVTPLGTQENVIKIPLV